MLILKVKPGETVSVGKEIHIYLDGFTEGRAVIGVEAPTALAIVNRGKLPRRRKGN